MLRRCWVSTLQEHVRDQLVFGRRRFGPGAHCQKHGGLELKGTKSKVYTAINTDQIWLYKSEQVRAPPVDFLWLSQGPVTISLPMFLQCFRNGIGITVIEARGATIRDGKHKSFDLITPYKTFRWVS